MSNYLTVGELASKLKVPKSWVYSRTRLRGNDQIPHLKCGKYCRFNFEIVVIWLMGQQKENME